MTLIQVEGTVHAFSINIFFTLVKCFYCDGGLRNWQPEDDPWTEHARWFSECGFVRLVKGDEFISKCINSHPPVSVPGVSSQIHVLTITNFVLLIALYNDVIIFFPKGLKETRKLIQSNDILGSCRETVS